MTAIVEDAEAINARCRALRIVCAARQNLPIDLCHCFGQGPGGSHLPCPGAPLPPPPDPFAELRGHCAQLGVTAFWRRR